MTFGKSISTCFSKYVTFSGRASRSEYWWWLLFTYLFSFLAGFLAGIVDGFLCGGSGVVSGIISVVVSLALFLPGLAVAVRRCHDTNHSGWWILCPIYDIVLMFLASDEGPNEYGELSE